MGGVAKQQVGEGGFVLCRRAPENGQVFLGDAVLCHGGGELSGDVPAAGEQHNAAHQPVQPVDGADAAGFRLAEGAAQQLRHAAGLVGGQNARGLEADHDARVGIKQLHARPSCLR